MINKEVVEKEKYVFGRLFFLANKLQIMGDQVFPGEMTITQWLLTAAIAQFGSSAPTLREVSELMGNSHQNVKQLAVKLQEKGFIEITRDEKDQRAICFSLTEKSITFWERRQDDVRMFLIKLFHELSNEEIDDLYESINKLYEKVQRRKK